MPQGITYPGSQHPAPNSEQELPGSADNVDQRSKAQIVMMCVHGVGWSATAKEESIIDGLQGVNPLSCMHVKHAIIRDIHNCSSFSSLLSSSKCPTVQVQMLHTLFG